jgi:hypothetical protein
MAVPVWATNDVPSASDFNDWLTNIRFVRKLADESVTSSTTFQNDDVLVLTVDANKVYELVVCLRCDGDAAGDIKCQFTVPSGTVYQLAAVRLAVSASTEAETLSEDWTEVNILQSGCVGAGNDFMIRAQGLVIVSSTGGSLQLQWAQNTSSAVATKVKARSYLLLKRVE